MIDPLFADETTRIDLECESRVDPAATVFASFARPHTARGEAELRSWLGMPRTTAESIRDAQDQIHDGVKTTAVFARLVGEAQPGRVQRYLDSQMEVPQVTRGIGGTLASAWTAARHPECVAVAREGRECVTRLLAACREWIAASEAAHASPGMKALRGLLRSSAEVITPELERSRGGTTGVLELDEALRGVKSIHVRKLLHVLGELDALHALATTVETRGWTFPVVREGAPHLVIDGLRHPLVSKPVENDVHLTGERRVLLLTGPNMAGKTTYLKSIGIAVYLAQVGMAVPARRMELTPFDRLVTVIGIHDSVASGSSAFHYEVTRLGQGLDALLAGKRCLLLFDELMRGTNAADAQEACRLVIDALLGNENGCVALSTHIAGLVDLFVDEARLTLGHFEAEMQDDSLAYDFRLRSGGYRGRMAMALLEQMGITAKLASLRGEAVAPRP